MDIFLELLHLKMLIFHSNPYELGSLLLCFTICLIRMEICTRDCVHMHTMCNIMLFFTAVVFSSVSLFLGQYLHDSQILF